MNPYEVPRTQLTVELLRRGLTGRGVEVGVASGIFSEYILSSWPGYLYMVDRWESAADYEEKYDQEENYRLAREVQARHPERCELVRLASVKAAERLFADGSLDFVYLDANHKYEEVKKDLAAWWPKVKAGGIFAGDDYGGFDYTSVNFGRGLMLFGVKKAVDEWALENKRNISIDWTAQWDCAFIDVRTGETRSVPARNWWLVR